MNTSPRACLRGGTLNLALLMLLCVLPAGSLTARASTTFKLLNKTTNAISTFKLAASGKNKDKSFTISWVVGLGLEKLMGNSSRYATATVAIRRDNGKLVEQYDFTNVLPSDVSIKIVAIE